MEQLTDPTRDANWNFHDMTVGSGTVSALAEKVPSTIRHPELVEGSAPRALARYQPFSEGESHRKLILRQAQDDGIMKVKFL